MDLQRHRATRRAGRRPRDVRVAAGEAALVGADPAAADGQGPARDERDEPADYRTFRLGLFGLDKLRDVDGTVADLGRTLDVVLRRGWNAGAEVAEGGRA